MDAMKSGTQPGSESLPTRLLEQVHPGMEVVDRAGERLGRVEDVRMGDPEAATTEGNDVGQPGEGSLVGSLARALGAEGAPDVPEPLRSQLLRSGYMKVDRPGWFASDRYIRGDQISAVSGNTVTLSVRKVDIPAER
jgi:hypothetical protein